MTTLRQELFDKIEQMSEEEVSRVLGYVNSMDDSVNEPLNMSNISKEQFDAEIQKAYNEALNGQGNLAGDVRKKIRNNFALGVM